MAPPCDAACMKIIINTGFVSALAPVLIGALPHDSRERSATTKLWSASSTLGAMLTARGLTAKPDADFSGCEHAQLLVQWIALPGAVDVARLDDWTADIWSAIADLAAGKLPA